MIGTGFIKCIPITLSGLLVTAAICVIEIEDVFVAKMVSSGQTSLNCLKILSFKSTFSVAASTTKPTFLTPSSVVVNVVMFAKVSALSASVIFSLATMRSKFFAMVSIPLFKEASLMSIKLTLNPDWAKVWAIPLPIVPAPITATCFMFVC